MSGQRQIPRIGDYALIGDCHTAALISPEGSIDWCCLPRFDSGSSFGRLLDEDRGGFCDVTVDGTQEQSSQSYVDDTLVLETRLQGSRGTVRLLDFMAMHADGQSNPRHELIRIVECERGSADVRITIAPRFDYGAVRPWLRRANVTSFTAIGGDDGLHIWSSNEITLDQEAMVTQAHLHAGERVQLVIRFVRPHLLDEAHDPYTGEAVDARLDETIEWWRTWRQRLGGDGSADPAAVRSGLTLKALTYAPTGAIVAAPTASLPETLGGVRNWDYRYSWVRDSAMTAQALADFGCEAEALGVRRFIVRSSAGHAEDLQMLFGISGERRIAEEDLDLAGYRDSKPVRIGNAAAKQLQLDTPGEILDLVWRWHQRGISPDDDEWRFFSELVEMVVERWEEPDCGIWEWRGQPRQFVHSKACCWSAVDRGLRLAEECARQAPVRRWRRARKEIRASIESRGYDSKRGIFVQEFEGDRLDSALLLLPVIGFIDFEDERMIRTSEAIHDELDENGFLLRYRENDELPGTEGAFLACSFWLAECYARQGNLQAGQRVFDQAMSAASPLGLFSEEVDPTSGELLGNYPQALTHLSHVSAAVALAEAQPSGATAAAAAE
jgi:GH15 family glucan-1,4-alpha-glucosidase